MPSLPTNTPRRSSPSGSGSSPPSVATVPSGRTTSRARMWALVTPSARQWGPPELLATLPPIEHVCWLLGSGAKWRSSANTARREVEVEHARLDPRPSAGAVDGQDAVHLGGRDHHRALGRYGTTGQAGARAAGDERHAVAHGDRARRPGRPASTAGSTPRRRRPPWSTRRGGTARARSRRRARGRATGLGAARRSGWSRRSRPVAARSRSRRAGRVGPAHEDDPAGLHRVAVDEQLVTRVRGDRRCGPAGRRARPAARARAPAPRPAPRGRRRRPAGTTA